MAASLAAGLVTMVAALSDRPRYAEHRDLHVRVQEMGRRLAARALELADEDAEAYAAFGGARALPHESEVEVEARSTAIAAAARRASEVPLQTVATCREIAAAAESLAGRSNVNASSDLVVAALLAEAAARGAALNVEVNLPSAADTAWAAATQERVSEMLAEVTELAATTREVVAQSEARVPVEAPPEPVVPTSAAARA